MTSTHPNTVRCQRIHWMLLDLTAQLDAWQAHRQQADRDAAGQYVGSHASQLAAVRTLLNGSLGVLQDELDGIRPEDASGEVFLRTRRVAAATVWLERVWRYLGQRFDQRDAPAGAPAGDFSQDPRAATVRAADEVVWSCYRPAFEHPRVQMLGLPPSPPPLPYVEPQYSPAARTGDRPLDGDLSPEGLAELREVAKQLPMPLLRLPPWCIGAPWWLVFVAHEVGHHLQHELELVGPVRLAAEAEAEAAGADPRSVERWGRWGQEIFADLVSILLVGPSALWAMVEVERQPAKAMQRRRPQYPSAWVRLRMMCGMLEHLDLDATAARRGWSLELPAGASAQLSLDVTVADRLADWPHREWPKIKTLHKLLDFDAKDFGKHGAVETWKTALLSDAPIQSQPHLDTARQVIAGSVAAWASLSTEIGTANNGDDLRTNSQRLARRTVQAVLASSPPGTRSSLMPKVDAAEPGRLLGRRLLELSVPAEEDHLDEDPLDDPTEGGA